MKINQVNFSAENATWFKAGYDRLAAIVITSSTLLGIFLSTASIFFAMESHWIIAATISGIWMAIVIGRYYIDMICDRAAK